MGIPRETKKITYSAEIRSLIKRLSLSDYQRAVLIGNILGDGHLEPNWSKTNYKLKINHQLKHKDYVIWEYQVFKDWILTEPKLDKWNNSFQFRTISHREITELRNKFYKNGKKIIPGDINLYLRNPITLAVWFMDDGNAILVKSKKGKRLRGYHLNSQSFTTEENIILKNSLMNLHGLSVGLEKNHGKYRIYVNKSSASRFKELIGEYVIPSMQYKFG
ncbi:MAG: hypothetical protein A3A33_00825 [Candidatus Yanofskybacteria bacterium RIFCSPLOWO2_01_FULL_49_25]|uniref:Homing endonuclease LAGLIDADG domain-containing protein n=1 Tax=Candidatus Yanofskybacteria bacterium RIFCSPLOWO2_01_FULL_49_25 TaxID=1802701 RepID=A0A1F8GZB9_9BACT|nr:MAG: hypothetical protein A3A33_00825 [Candidatus Yanofskybacteria bacterium RIFCSPLOWO2_01_FULL_49_25]